MKSGAASHDTGPVRLCLHGFLHNSHNLSLSLLIAKILPDIIVNLYPNDWKFKGRIYKTFIQAECELKERFYAI